MANDVNNEDLFDQIMQENWAKDPIAFDGHALLYKWHSDAFRECIGQMHTGPQEAMVRARIALLGKRALSLVLALDAAGRRSDEADREWRAIIAEVEEARR